MQELTDLEGAAMAKIARSGKCTSYAVAKSFAESPSDFWSGSAGAVYPLIKRLLARKLLKCAKERDGKRARSDFSITPEGRAALRGWLLDSRRAAGLGFDPLRTRVIHLDLVSSTERSALFEGVERWLSEMSESKTWADSPRDQRIHKAVLASRKSLLKVLAALASP